MVKPPGSLRFADILALGLNAIVGSGIFLFPGTLAALAGPSSVLVFLVTAALLGAVALCYAELGGMFKGSGGSYLYAREAFGDRVGFGVGVLAWSTAVLSWAAVASLLGGHLAWLHPVFGSPWAGRLASACLLGAFGAVNYRGIRPAAWTVDFLTLAKLAPLCVFVLACLPRADPARFTPFFSGEGRYGYAVFLALWALQGFEVAPVPAGEAADPQRAVPKAVLGSLGVAAVLYVLVQAAAVGVHPGLSTSVERPLADAARAGLGPWGERLLAAGGLVSMLGFMAGAALGGPRYLSALGGRHLGPWRLGETDPVSGVPRRAVAATTGLGAALVLVLPSMNLVDMANFSVVTQYLASSLALPVLRRRRPDLARPYRLPAADAVSGAAVLVCLWLMTQVTLREVFSAAAVLAAAYVLRRRLDGAWVSPRSV